MDIFHILKENSSFLLDANSFTFYNDFGKEGFRTDNNICHFLPFHKDVHSIHTINFVLETVPQPHDRLRSESVYKMYYVLSGSGAIHTTTKISPLTHGDIFFTFPGSYFAIESWQDFSYMYISFVGLRGNEIMESLSINTNNFIFQNCIEVEEFWEKGIYANPKVVHLMSESIIMYTFAHLGNRILPERNQSKAHHSVDIIKKYIDDHYADHDLSLESMHRALSYNKKYISHIFKKHFGVGIVEYLNTVRIQNALTVIKQGFTSVNDIADRCGYSDSQYFSKVFKSQIGIAPTKYIGNLQSRKE